MHLHLYLPLYLHLIKFWLYYTGPTHTAQQIKPQLSTYTKTKKCNLRRSGSGVSILLIKTQVMRDNTHKLWRSMLVTKSGYSCCFRKTQRKCDLPQFGLIFIIKAEILCWQINYFIHCHYVGISHSCSFQDIRSENKTTHKWSHIFQLHYIFPS